MIISGNSQINKVYYSGYTISKIYACGGSLVWSSGPAPQYRTISGTPYCEVYDKMVDVYSQVSYDGGQTWTTTSTTPTLVEHNSEDCGYVPPATSGKVSVTYYYNYQYHSYDVPCNGNTTLSASEVYSHAPNKDYITSVAVGDCVTVLDSSFVDFSILREVSLPSSLEDIRIQTFRNNTSLVHITIPDSVHNMAGGVFMGCTSLQSCNLSKNIVDSYDNLIIQSTTFYNCSSLTSVTFSDSLDTIENNAFYGCSSLPTITLPSTIRVIKTGAFQNTTNLTSITINAITPPILESGVFRDSGLSVIYVPDEAVNSYKTSTYWIDFESIIKPISEKP